MIRNILFVLILFFISLVIFYIISEAKEEEPIDNYIPLKAEKQIKECNVKIVKSKEHKDNEVTVTTASDISDSDVKLVAWVTMGEAEGECEEGKRLVIDTIFNRVEHEGFPNSIYEVIYQPSQFSCVWDGRLDRVSATEEVCQLVREEFVNRYNSEVLYFRADYYGEWGTRLFQIGNHYFCSE